ncbi:MAG: tetratricopeptide repeat protein [Hyphomicrobiales bacterium]
MLMVSRGSAGLMIRIAVVLAMMIPFSLHAAEMIQSTGQQNSRELDALFERLKTAETGPEGARIASEIQRLWSQSGSDTADLLMERADEAIAEEDFPLAIEILDRLVVLQPDWAEAWNRRATVFFLTDDYRRSVADIGEVLRLEPRHYGAISGLGLIYRSLGDDKRAFRAFEQALEIYPQNESMRESLEELRPSAEGLDL